MTSILLALHQDEAGFIVSSELVLIATITVIGLVVGMAEVANGVNEELEDVGSAVGQVNQSFVVSGSHGHKAATGSSSFKDVYDYCDGQFDINGNTTIPGEGNKHYGNNYSYNYGYNN
ncbi:MAG: branched-chain amino acid aminotransferase [Planctomycetaceae bacterium]|nr:branched-chain amino acid aminotransferase [Planctomycetaceae bacterium]